MPSEYNPTMDGRKTVPMHPRPLTKVQHRLRAFGMTGDPTGASPHDPNFWYGSTARAEQAAIGLAEAQIEASKAWDDYFGNNTTGSGTPQGDSPVIPKSVSEGGDS